MELGKDLLGSATGQAMPGKFLIVINNFEQSVWNKKKTLEKKVLTRSWYGVSLIVIISWALCFLIHDPFVFILFYTWKWGFWIIKRVWGDAKGDSICASWLFIVYHLLLLIISYYLSFICHRRWLYSSIQSFNWNGIVEILVH